MTAEKNKKVFVALSGGVDSAVAAASLLKAGYDCTAVYMKLYPEPMHSSSDAQQVAEHLGIDFKTVDFSAEFDSVIEYFKNEYCSARTPNPCVLCNRNIKFGKFFDYCLSQGTDYIATGHYAKIIDGRLYSADSVKDQSYALAMVKREVFQKVLFPLDNIDKTQTRELASELGLAVSDKPDSQDICFIENNDYAAKVSQLCPSMNKDGYIVDKNGKILGHHQGIHNFTIGQRRGLKVAMGIPWYVTKLGAKTNTVKLGTKDELLSSSLLAENTNWLIDEQTGSFDAMVKIRYNHKAVAAEVEPLGGGRVRIHFKTEVSAVTPGQLAVFYIDDRNGRCAAGAAWIKKSEN